MRILITGSNGLLGQKIVKYCLINKISFLATSFGENRNREVPSNYYASMDITDSFAIEEVVRRYEPTHIINTAAITNVDACEEDQELCQRVNVFAVQCLLDICKEYGIHFQQLSTDFVFDGVQGDYSEEDPVNPLSVYAQSKVASEAILMNSGYENWSIVRTIIVFGTGYSLSRSNIVLWAIDALRKGDSLIIVNDQFRAPTWADDLAKGCMLILEKDKTGIFHISGPESFSIAEIVRKIAQYVNAPIDLIRETSSAELNQKAPRPPRTGFDLSKAKEELGYAPLAFEEALKVLDEELKSNVYSNPQ